VSVAAVAVWVLLAVGVAVEILGVVGVLAAADVFDRLHFTGPASVLAPVALALAVVIDEGPLSQAGIKSLLVAMVISGTSPVLVHATARAARIRERGNLDPLPEELGER
jgi:monovalent cation/proton antiporter MnhG/PhaG subunit